MEEESPVGVHLVGSVPLGSAEDVFRAAAGTLATACAGCPTARPDRGRTGSRGSTRCSARCPGSRSRGGAGSYRALPQLRLRPGSRRGRSRSSRSATPWRRASPTGAFERLKRDGVIAQRCRFLVSLPTPAGAGQRVRGRRRPGGGGAGLPRAHARGGARDRGRRARRPAGDPVGRALRARDARGRDGARGSTTPRRESSSASRAWAPPCPSGVELGFHFCFGDDDHGHFAEPDDSRSLVDLANAVVARLDRPLDFLHLPVPAARDRRGLVRAARGPCPGARAPTCTWA